MPNQKARKRHHREKTKKQKNTHKKNKEGYESDTLFLSVNKCLRCGFYEEPYSDGVYNYESDYMKLEPSGYCSICEYKRCAYCNSFFTKFEVETGDTFPHNEYNEDPVSFDGSEIPLDHFVKKCSSFCGYPKNCYQFYNK